MARSQGLPLLCVIDIKAAPGRQRTLRNAHETPTVSPTDAAALAIGLVLRGKTVHLSTTDPAAYLDGALAGDLPGL